MQSVTGAAGGAAALLFLRSAADLSCAVRTANDLLSRRRLLGAADDEVLGILVGDGSSLQDPACGDVRSRMSTVTLRESVTLSGIWSLCWFDLGPRLAGQAASRRRRRLLEALRADDASEVARPRTFFPVLTGAEASQEPEAIVGNLENRYRALAIGPDYFVHDPPRGGIVQAS